MTTRRFCGRPSENYFVWLFLLFLLSLLLVVYDSVIRGSDYDLLISPQLFLFLSSELIILGIICATAFREKNVLILLAVASPLTQGFGLVFGIPPMFNPFIPIILFVSLLTSNKSSMIVSRVTISIAGFVIYCSFSGLIFLMFNNNQSENVFYWLIQCVSFLFIGLFHSLDYDEKDNVVGERVILVLLSVFVVIIMVSSSIAFRVNSMRYGYLFKSGFTFPLMSSSNYTISIITLLVLFLMGSSLPNLIKLFVVASFVMSVFLAQSRSNVVGLVIVVGTALLFKSVFNLNRRTLKSLVKRTVLILVVILTMLMSFDFVAGSITDSRLFNRFIDSRYLGNVYSRFSLWNEYIEEIVGGSAITFIFGYGMGNQSRLIDIAGSPTRRPHNGYLLLLHQVGILGLLLYCWFFFEIARISRVMSLIVLYSGTVAFFEPLVLTGWFEILLVALSSFEFKTQHFENRA